MRNICSSKKLTFLIRKGKSPLIEHKKPQTLERLLSLSSSFAKMRLFPKSRTRYEPIRINDTLPLVELSYTLYCRIISMKNKNFRMTSMLDATTINRDGLAGRAIRVNYRIAGCKTRGKRQILNMESFAMYI